MFAKSASLAHMHCWRASEVSFTWSKKEIMGAESMGLVASPYMGHNKAQELCASPLNTAVKVTKQGGEGITKGH